MGIRSPGAVLAAALLACFAFSGRSRAVSIVHDYQFDVTGSYTIVADPPYSGTIEVAGSPTDDVLSADIFLPNPSLEFKTILTHFLDGSQYDLDLEDTTDSYELVLVIDNASDLFNGVDGATVDSNSELITYPGDNIVAGSFSGTLDVPAPAALPVFASALTMLGLFRRRRNSGPA